MAAWRETRMDETFRLREGAPMPSFAPHLSMTPMRRSLLLLTLALAAPALPAQEVTPDLPAQALQAVLRFRGDLGGDSTRIAGCRLDQIGDSTGTGRLLDERFRALVVLPAGWTPGALTCGVQAFARAPHPTLWLEQIVEVRRTSPIVLPYPGRLQYEVTLQWLVDAGYREYHRYLVAPRVFLSETGSERFGDFRVIEFKLLGADHHWADNAGHGSSVRRP